MKGLDREYFDNELNFKGQKDEHETQPPEVLGGRYYKDDNGR